VLVMLSYKEIHIFAYKLFMRAHFQVPANIYIGGFPSLKLSVVLVGIYTKIRYRSPPIILFGFLNIFVSDIHKEVKRKKIYSKNLISQKRKINQQRIKMSSGSNNNTNGV
jgi:hypothetical protein